MDGVVHPNVEQAIGRDRIRKALKRYENRPADEHRYGIVRSVNEDGSYEVLLDGDVQTSRCAQYGTALVGDRVLAVTKKDGRNDLIGRLGGEIGGGGTVVTKVDDVSNYIAGRVFAHAGMNDPAGALLCDGRAVSRREYWELFDAIGTTYGAGDGSTTFNLPNIESRTIIGESDSYALGATGGEDKHTLTEGELPKLSGRAWFRNWTWGGGSQGSTFLSPDGILKSESGGSTGYDLLSYGSAQGGSTILKAEFGGNQSHNNMQPYIVMRYFITTGKGDPVSGINPADYVVEWGKTGEWRWEKWASGKAECWATLTRQDSIQSSFGQFNLSYLSLLMTYPFEFVEEPIVTASANAQDYTLFTTLSGGSTTQTPYVNAARPANAAITTKIDIEYSIRAVGEWKDSPASGGTETIAQTIAERFEGIEADILDMRKTKVLATTASFMNADQTVTLSEAISEQDNGVMLVWSGYYNGSSQNYDWVFIPVPKHHVLKHNGQGICCSALCGDGHMMKYVYVSDTKIDGHSSGTDTSTIDGVTRANNKFVLRYVIGY